MDHGSGEEIRWFTTSIFRAIIEKDKKYSALEKDLIFLKEKINVINNEIEFKEHSIHSLKEEISILKSIIDEKDKTIDFLKG